MIWLNTNRWYTILSARLTKAVRAQCAKPGREKERERKIHAIKLHRWIKDGTCENRRKTNMQLQLCMPIPINVAISALATHSDFVA